MLPSVRSLPVPELPLVRPVSAQEVGTRAIVTSVVVLVILVNR